jgi:hypothetical protein
MPSENDYSNEVLWVYPPRGDEVDHWCKEHGNVKLPIGWAFLPSGDAFVTRKVKEIGLYWIAVKAARNYTRKLGIWAPEKNIKAALELAKESEVRRQSKRIMSRQQRAKKETKHQEVFTEAVYHYLAFTPSYWKLARQIAQGTAEQATVVGSERVGRTKKLTLEEKAILAARAYIRHHYTDYEDRLINSELIIDEDSILYQEIKNEAQEEVDEFLNKHR